MTTPANLTYTAIETRVMNGLRIPTSNTTEQAKVQALINEVYRDVCAKQDWWWLLKRAVINTSPKLANGFTNIFNVVSPASVNLTVNSSTITFLTAITQDVKGFVLTVPGQANDSLAVYRVATHGGATATAILDANYTDVTSTASGFRLYQDSYSLPVDCGKLLQVKRYGERLPLRRVGLEDFSQVKLSDVTEGKPELYTIIDFATTGDPTTQRQLQVHPYPDKAYRLELFYKQNLNTELSGTTQPFIPDDYRQILVYGSLARGYPIFLNDVERGKYYQSLFNDVLALMAAQQREYASDHSGVAPDWRLRKPARRRGATTLGNFFDTLPSDRW